jgi:integrase
MPRAAALPLVRPELVELYLAHRVAQGMGTDHKVRWGARALLAAVPDLARFCDLPLERQLGFNHETHRFISWLSVTGHLRPGPDYLVARRPRLGIVLARTDPELHLQFMETARSLGFRDHLAHGQFNLLGHLVALAGRAPRALRQADWDEGRRLLLEAADRIPNRGVKALSTALFNLEATLFHAGLSDALPRRRSPNRADIRAQEWASVPAPLAASMQHYLQQIMVTLRPGTVKNAELTLREFALLVSGEDTTVARAADLQRRHVERYKRWLLDRPAARGGPLHRHTVRDRLSKLRGFFRRLDEWDADDRPARQLVFDSDFPIADEPLPRFLDDAAAAKLLAAARNDPDPFARLAVELLARTGMRRSEMLGLTIDAVVQIGSAYWLRVPVGKMHTDRYVPLHPQLKTLLDDWLLHRPEGLRSDLLFTDHGRPVNASRIETAVRRAAERAGLGRVTPHQLRHTLATQAINRGMSLEAIAALLGHRSLAMTRVYARIADRTVADEYFAVSEKVEALYDAPRQLPAEAEGSEMAKLRREMHRRMLGNGYCARPVEMDCHFESICESCTFFVTTIEFRPTLERQREDAASKGQVAREQIFDGLLARLDEQVS